MMIKTFSISINTFKNDRMAKLDITETIVRYLIGCLVMINDNRVTHIPLLRTSYDGIYRINR